MSTRCHIIIKGFKPMLYRHCDGYPGKADGSDYGVLPDLIPFLSSFKRWRGRDESYLLARLAQHMGNIFSRGEDPEALVRYGPDYLSLGIDLDLHGDEAYVYVIDCGNGLPQPVPGSVVPNGKWTVEVREPTDAFWDYPTLENTTVIEVVTVPDEAPDSTGPSHV